MYFPVILGAHRESRRSAAVAQYVHDQLVTAGIETEIIDTRDYLKSLSDEDSSYVQEYIKKIERMDGLFVVCPEYNWGYPGSLKMLLDETLKPYNHKPVAFCGVSSGRIGGERVHINMLPVFYELGLRHVAAVSYGNVKELFDEAGKIQDEKYDERMKKAIGIMQAYAAALAPVRDKLTKE